MTYSISEEPPNLNGMKALEQQGRLPVEVEIMKLFAEMGRWMG
jgi:hypothetical protein